MPKVKKVKYDIQFFNYQTIRQMKKIRKKLFTEEPKNETVKRCKTCNAIIKNSSSDYCLSKCAKVGQRF